MKLVLVKRMNRRNPFRPFRIHLTTGEVLPVDDPENVSDPRGEEDLFVVWTHRACNLGGQPNRPHQFSTQKRAIINRV